VGRFLELDEGTRRLATSAWQVAWRGLVEKDPSAARPLELALSLAGRPSAWAAETGELFAIHHGLRDGALRDGPLAAEPAEEARSLADLMRPRCAEIAAEWARHETVPVDVDGPAPFPAGDLALQDDVFQVHLAATFEGRPGTYREGQHQVAREVPRTLGEDELLLVHAPTGTGKTLAYLVPAMLWSARHGVRVGVSTYTRPAGAGGRPGGAARAARARSRKRHHPAAGQALWQCEPIVHTPSIPVAVASTTARRRHPSSAGRHQRTARRAYRRSLGAGRAVR
jgi:hypothetical protein